MSSIPCFVSIVTLAPNSILHFCNNSNDLELGLEPSMTLSRNDVRLKA